MAAGMEHGMLDCLCFSHVYVSGITVSTQQHEPMLRPEVSATAVLEVLLVEDLAAAGGSCCYNSFLQLLEVLAAARGSCYSRNFLLPPVLRP